MIITLHFFIVILTLLGKKVVTFCLDGSNEWKVVEVVLEITAKGEFPR
jgi:hypothetical protein